ncbi:Hsp33 family molecular chaperone HslO [Novosphingobium sp. YJ-S2-02]|uniref:Hsp33 family molecular chaperone HslO n=1 Tax=Novosphingobium aureum TaxID=2792964 RepID=A0A931HG53_9SPHN|nr:Hsp33 family molecular chaperone HslO [Novosphingobium aureum]MBH0114726.1 Hsp33 family molecular chaperone HslO [Novosphingobium aureum]
MSEDPIIRTDDTGFDRVLSFSVPSRHARGRIVRLGPVLETVLSAHDYPPVVKHLLAEALVLTALMGSLLKDEGSQLTLQAQAEGGAVDLLVCDYRDAKVRGYARFDEAQLAQLGDEPRLEELFAKGYFAITFDLASTKERYQGVVPLEGDSLAHACEAYFAQSEQIPTLIRAAVRSSDQRCMGAGMLIQHLPDGEEGKARLHAQEEHPDWEHVSVMAGSVQRDELLDPVLSLEQLLWRLFHEEDEVRVEPLDLLERGCRCTVEHYANILGRFPEDQLSEMRDDDGTIPVDCAFCSKILHIPL